MTAQAQWSLQGPHARWGCRAHQPLAVAARTPPNRRLRMGQAGPLAAFGTTAGSDAPVQEVPSTLAAANAMFLTHPSALAPAAGIAALTTLRLGSPAPVNAAEIAVVAGVVALWLVQEWVVHRWLLHSSWEWPGKAIHKEHHEQPYHHVSLDPPELIIGVMLLAAAVAAVVLGPVGSPVWLTGTATYWLAGLLYEWLHFIVHTRWAPPAGWLGTWLRAVRRHHMLHHLRNESYWLSFSAPAVDALFGTLPSSSSAVPMTAMARIAHGVAAAHKQGPSKGGNSSSSSDASNSASQLAAAVTARR